MELFKKFKHSLYLLGILISKCLLNFPWTKNYRGKSLLWCGNFFDLLSPISKVCTEECPMWFKKCPTWKMVLIEKNGNQILSNKFCKTSQTYIPNFDTKSNKEAVRILHLSTLSEEPGQAAHDLVAPPPLSSSPSFCRTSRPLKYIQNAPKAFHANESF